MSNKVPYAVAMNHDSICDILIHVNTISSLRANLAQRDFLVMKDDKRYDMFECLARRCADEIDELLPIKEFRAQGNLPPNSTRAELKKLRVLAAFEVAAARLMTLYGEALSAYPGEMMLGDIISRDSAFCWYDITEEQLAAAGSLRNYILNNLTAKHVMAAAKEKVYHSFHNDADILMIFQACQAEITVLLPETPQVLNAPKKPLQDPDQPLVDLTYAAIDKICRQIYSAHKAVIIANLTSGQSIAKVLDRQNFFRNRD